MSAKYPHDYLQCKVNPREMQCCHCGVLKSHVDCEMVSRRCSLLTARWWAGRLSAGEAQWVKGEALPGCKHWPVGTPASVCYDEHYDISPEVSVWYEGTLTVSVPAKKHVMGHDPEQIDWAAHKAFLGESQ